MVMHVAVESLKAARGVCTPTCIHTRDLRSHTQQTRSTEKDEDVNWVRTNLRTGKKHSAKRRDAPQKLYYNSAVSCTEALQILHEICADFLWN